MRPRLPQIILILLAFTGCATPVADKLQDTKAIIQTNENIRVAFSDGDIAGILKYHHPQVEKVLSSAG